MKYTKYLLLPFICLLLSACDKDSNGSNNSDRPETLAWIEDIMRKHYYWSDKIPASGKLSYTADEEDFFTSLLYKAEDGKTRNGVHSYFSSIEKVAGITRQGYVQEDYSYGFEFASVSFSGGYYGALVLCVLPGTPAERAELKRGDWIMYVNDKRMTSSSDVMSLYGDVAKTFKIYKWSNASGFVSDRSVNIGIAEAIEYNPIYRTKTYTIGTKKVGYLVYNSFKAGINDSGTAYDDRLRELSSGEFNGVNEFVLDLRYNNGGLLTSTRLLCAILGPRSVLSETKFGYYEYNNGSKEYFKANSAQGNGNNLNLQRLFVLVSGSSASASEAVINLLSPYMDVVVIGETTYGKNVGSSPFESSDKVWKMQPITVKIFNHDGKSDYANGWVPDITKGDVFDYDSQGYVTLQEDILELGNTNERLLKIALGIIGGTYTGSSVRSAEAGKAYKLGPSSLDRKEPILLID